MLNRTIAPEVFPINNFELIRPQSEQLPNGVPLHVLRAGTQPVVGLYLIFKAGNWFAPNKEVTYFTTKMLMGGTSRRKAAEITEEIDKYGAFVEMNSGFDYATIELYCLTKYMRPLYSLLRELLTDSVFPQTELESMKNITAQQLLINFEKTNFAASVKFRELLFGAHHPYGTELGEQHIGQLDRNQLESFYIQSFKDRPFEIIVAGDIGAEETAVIRDIFGSLPATTAPAVGNNPKDEGAPVKPGQQLYIEKDNAMQTSVRIGKKLITRQHADYVSFRVVNEILGGYFGSRLMKNIREEKGYTYGIHSSLITFKNEGYLVIGTDVGKEVRNETVEEVFKEIELLKNEEVSAEELDMVKNYMKGSFINSLNTPFAIAEKYKNIYFNHLREDYYSNYIATIDAITAQQVQELANKYLSGDFTQVLVG